MNFEKFWRSTGIAACRIARNRASSTSASFCLKGGDAFAASLAICIFAAPVAAMLVPRLYESQVVLEIGSLGFDRPVLEPAETVVERLRTEYEVGNNNRVRISGPFVSDVRTSRQAKNYVTITAAGRDAEEAQKMLETVVAKLLREHRTLMQSGLVGAGLQLALLDEQIARAQQDLSAIDARVQKAVVSNRSTEVMALLSDKHRLMQQQVTLEQLKVKTQAEIAEAEARATRIVKAPTVPTSPSGWGLPLYLVLGLVAGLALGILAALAGELIAALRAQRALVE